MARQGTLWIFIETYLQLISDPLLERGDIHLDLDVPLVNFSQGHEKKHPQISRFPEKPL